ncbi:MAG: hypothetical protein JSS04_10665 [Proteobacteria bacterium]|nr:hypothetical protein [Pseudomonadota bacterium]
MTEHPSFSKDDEPRREDGNGRVACPICGALVNLADVAEVSRHLNGLHSAPADRISF